ncbi:MAG: hypothetical protein Q7T78_11135 [Rhodoferax sp.]|nr:hypothetical protein [Rhodoferax sp.]
MTKHVRDIATDIDGFMKRKTLNVWTLPWTQLYEVTARVRIKDAFQIDLKSALKKQNLEINYGTNAIVIHRDSNFGPQKYD